MANQKQRIILDVDASHPAAGVKSRDIQIFLRFYAASLVRLNAQNHQPIFLRTLRSTTVSTFAKADRGAAGGIAAFRPVSNGFL